MRHRVLLGVGPILFWSGLLLAQAYTLGGVGPCNPNDDGCTTPPRVTYSPAPEYSDQARQAKLGGTCILMLVVGVDGHTSDVKVVSGLGMGLSEKAIEAAKKWTFEPGIRKGKPVPVKIAMEVVFDCQGACKATVPGSPAN